MSNTALSSSLLNTASSNTMTMAALGDRCEELASPNIGNFVLSILLLLGMLISYLPQHMRIIQRRTSEGISPYFVLLGTTSGTCAIANILALPTSREDMACCKSIGSFACTAGLLGIAQVGAQWACFFVITLLFLIFTPRLGAALPTSNPSNTSTTSSSQPPPASFRTAFTVVGICIIHLLLTFIATVFISARAPNQLAAWANILGLACTVLTSIQYLPQIYTTYRLKHVGSLSIPMMLLQTPGAFVLAASLGMRLGWKGWSAWLVYVVAGTLQGVLLVMAVVFEARNIEARERAAETQDGSETEETDGGDDEVTPLLRERIHDGATASVVARRLNHEQEDVASSSGSAPIAIERAGDEETSTEEGAGDKRRSSVARWANGDFSFKAW